MKKRCCRCREDKDESAFYRNKSRKSGLSDECIQCTKEMCKINYDKDPERHRRYKREVYKRDKAAISARNRAYSAAHRHEKRAYDIQRYYGISKDVYDQYMSVGKCLICGSEEKLCLDHDHITGAIRGCLCSFCNTGLGYFKDSTELLQKAIFYLSK
jgi:hypothetical protein